MHKVNFSKVSFLADEDREKRNKIIVETFLQMCKTLLPRVEKTLERLNLPNGGKHAFGDQISLVDLTCLTNKLIFNDAELNKYADLTKPGFDSSVISMKILLLSNPTKRCFRNSPRPFWNLLTMLLSIRLLLNIWLPTGTLLILAWIKFGSEVIHYSKTCDATEISVLERYSTKSSGGSKFEPQTI